MMYNLQSLIDGCYDYDPEEEFSLTNMHNYNMSDGEMIATIASDSEIDCGSVYGYKLYSTMTGMTAIIYSNDFTPLEMYVDEILDKFFSDEDYTLNELCDDYNLSIACSEDDTLSLLDVVETDEPIEELVDNYEDFKALVNEIEYSDDEYIKDGVRIEHNVPFVELTYGDLASVEIIGEYSERW